MTVVEDSLHNNIKLCECGCKQPVTYNKYRPCRFIHGHNQKGKGGRIIIRGYILIRKPEHPFANKIGYVREHRLVMEEYLDRYLDPKEVVHHITSIKKGGMNDISNLKLFSNNSEHISHEFSVNRSNRICYICKSDKTYINRKRGYTQWFKFENSFICRKCYDKIRYKIRCHQ